MLHFHKVVLWVHRPYYGKGLDNIDISSEIRKQNGDF